ncbi:MAG TPA: DUF6504 family protein [Mycobacteriales bacterium]|nr:DUF6504 family protein [Mycobacteriales bacterium]
MTRLHADPVEVRTAAAADGPVPEQFLWRGRLYLVREVLARWTASGTWWKADSAPADDTGVGEREQQWWRVEADSGRLAALSGGRGTYDLCFCWHTGWSLQRVLD